MKRFLWISPLVRENLSVALKSIRNNGLRSLLTILIIAVGITSLVGILTATDALKREVFSSFEKFGTTSFSIVQKYFSSEGGARSRVRNNTAITYGQAQQFKRLYGEEGTVSVYSNVLSDVAVKFEGESSNPTSRVVAADENYLRFINVPVQHGRGISVSDMELASQVCIIGNGVARTLFKDGASATGKVISVNGYRYVNAGARGDVVQDHRNTDSLRYGCKVPVQTLRISLVVVRSYN